MRRILVFLVIIVLVFAFAGCGAPDTAGSGNEQNAQPQEKTDGVRSSADIIEPEQIITLEEASGIMGMGLVMGVKTDNEVVGQKLCEYETADPEEYTSFQISVNQLAFMPLEQVENGITPDDIYLFTKDDFSDTLELVSGIGDDAFIDTPGLHLLYRGYYVLIALGNSDDPVNIERLKTAGQKAVANLDALLD